MKKIQMISFCSHFLHSLIPKSRVAKWSALVAIPLAGVASFYAISQTAPPNIVPVELSADPLYAQGSGQKPTLTLALSVEFPTVGAQYRAAYAQATTYPGYFDSESCYSYNNNANEDLRRFDRTGAAAAHSCAGAGFSGNFLNWATSSSIDVLRLGLTGGDRIQDTSSLTVLQRAVLQKNFWNNGSYFPQKSISLALAQKALPTTLIGNHNNTIYISNCLNQVFFSTAAASGSCDTPTYTNSLGAKRSSGANPGPAGTSTALSTNMFFTRVQVCESSGGTLQDPRPTLCQKYPDGNFKPVGNMQKYSDRVRLSAFGYLMDNGNTRYGGVLRAPMKFVGAKAYDADGIPTSGNNPKREWELNSGIFIANPESATEGISGVINYLNKFGRTGTTPGTYKSNDPVGELYYESLRYLQGLGPTPNAVSGLNAALKDGFPVYETWTDPFAGSSNTKSYACLKNNVFLIGDVNTHNDKSIPGNTRTSNSDFSRTAEVNLDNNIPNFVDWTQVVGGFESNNAVTYLDGNGAGISRTTSNPTGSVNAARWGMESQDTGSSRAAYYMAGMAYWAHTHDIRGENWTDSAKRRPGLRTTTYVLDVNENSAQDNANNRRNSQFFLTAKYGGFSDASGTGNPFLPSNNNANWEKQNDPGEAKTYFLASNASAVLSALDNIFAATAAAGTSISGAAPSTSQLSTSDGYVYQPKFDPEYWSGDLRRSTIKLDADGNVVQPTTGIVSAASAMDALNSTQLAARKIFVGKANRPVTGAYATAFDWSAIETGTGSLQDLLNKGGPTAAADGLGESRLAFLRGDRSQEVTTFRKRNSRLGDIVNSAPVYMGPPKRSISTPAYNTFYTANAARTKAVFIGANDGMLHAFDAATMQELFAYIPSWMGSKLSLLTTTTYNSGGHTSFVDATPTVGEADLGTPTTPAWKTVLVSGTGGGGQGVFALDVTDPTAFAANKVLWEFTDQDDVDMGNVVGAPRIMKLLAKPATTSPAAPAVYKWFAVVPSGVNNYVNDGYYSTTGSPALFFLDLSKDTGTAWALGTNYFKVSFPIPAATANGTQLPSPDGRTVATGIINFEATQGNSGEVQYIYAGDMHGNMWKLDMLKADFSETTSTSWDLAKVSAYTSSSTPVPFYRAKDSAGKVQPITAVPTVAFGPAGKLIVAFGTGKYLEPTDNQVTSDSQIQSFYTLYDDLADTTLDTASGSSYTKGRVRLKAGSIASGAITVPSFSWGRPLTDGDLTKRAGWYIDFPYGGVNGGERLVTSAVLLGNKIYFNSQLPPNASSDACGGGASYTYAANLASGLGTITASSTGLQGSPLVFTVSSSVTNSDSTGARVKTEKSIIANQSPSTSDKLNTTDKIETTSDVGRLSWRQINNYQDLKNKSW